MDNKLVLLTKHIARATPGIKKARSYLREYFMSDTNVLTYQQYLNDYLHLTCELKREV